MKNLRVTILLLLITAMFSQCTDNFFTEEDNAKASSENDGSDLKSASHGRPESTFTVTVENVSTEYDYFAAGGQFIPDGKEEAGPAFPGESFTIKFHAGKSHRISFATMYGASNDLFYGPSDLGIDLFDDEGNPTTGDITNLISLWDCGTEINHAPGSGEQGDEESDVIKSVQNVDNKMDGFTYNTVEQNVAVSLAYDGVSMFTLTIQCLEGSSTPLSPVAWVVHSDMQKPIFTEGSLDYDLGLEALSETGNAVPLSEYLEAHSGYVSPVAPGVWVVHKQGQKPIFTNGTIDYGEGLEMLSEMGDPSMEYSTLLEKGYETGVYNTPEGADGPGPLFPGESYSFTFDANPGDYLSIASMLGKSNDLFFAPGDMGIRLFNGKKPLECDITSKIFLWDAGTEVNEYPGAGIHQGAGGVDENEPVMQVDDEFTWPQTAQVIKVTISASGGYSCSPKDHPYKGYKGKDHKKGKHRR